MSINIYAVYEDCNLKIFNSLECLPELGTAKTIWIDIETQSRELLTEVALHFGLHELTIEDSLDLDHFPKLEDFGTYLFLIFRGLSLKPSEHLVQNLEDEEDRDHSEDCLLYTSPSPRD